MNDHDNRVIDLGVKLKAVRDREGIDLDSERIRNLAFQATKLPTTLSKSEIEALGHAVLAQTRPRSRTV